MPDSLQQQLQTALGTTYTIERELGGGGMSRVFVAHEVALDRDVVVKVLAPELAEGLSAERFAREIRLAAALQEPHIVAVLAAGATADGLPYYTMPFVRGESLRARMVLGRCARWRGIAHSPRRRTGARLCTRTRRGASRHQAGKRTALEQGLADPAGGYPWLAPLRGTAPYENLLREHP